MSPREQRPATQWHATRRRLATGAGVVAVLLGIAVSALAVWSTSGSGAAAATVGSLDAPTGVTVTSFGPRVTVNWTESVPPEGTLTGYRVTRYQAGTRSDACGTSPVTFLAAGTTTCTDADVPDGTYQYTVTAAFRTWTAESVQSNSVTVVLAETAPTQTVSLASGATNAHLVGTTLYYRPSAPGGFQLVSTLTGTAFDPASATFPDTAAAGWTHPAETVTTGTGTPPTIAYTSSSYTWTASPANPPDHTVTGANTMGDTVQTILSMTADNAGPTGGALTVNGTAASAGTTTSATNTDFTISTRTDYSADAGSGVSNTVLTRQSASLSNGICGTFGGTTVLTGTPTQTGLATGCYLYTLTGSDNVGNTSSISTVVTYDTTAPTQSVALTNGVGASQDGNIIYYRNAQSGSFSLNTSVTDADSGSASVTYPAVAASGWTHDNETVTSGTGVGSTRAYSSSTYSFASGAAEPATQSIVGRDVSGNAVTTNLTFTNDVTAPTGGALTVNGTVSTAGSSTSTNNTGAFTIDLRTDYTTDAGSGVASSVLTVASAPLTAGTCGSYAAATTVVGTPNQSGLTTGCYRYVLTGTDKVGNIASVSTIVRVDLQLPTGGALTVNGVAATGSGSTSSARATFPIDSRTDWTDAESGITATGQLVRTQAPLSGGSCGTFGTPTTITGTVSQSGLTTNCYRYTLTGTDNVGNSRSIFTTVVYDVEAPDSGALTVNGGVASAAGTVTSANTNSFAISVRTDYTDAASGLASSTLTREFAAMTGSTCGASFGTPTTIVGAPAQTGLPAGCYRYTLTGTDNAGNTAAITTTVKLGVYVSAVSLVNKTGGIAGRMEQGDRIVITFSDQIAVATLCSTWSGDSTDQLINTDNAITVNLNNAGGGDFVNVSSAAGVCTLNFNTLNLGGGGYTNTNTATKFGGTGTNKTVVAWSASARQLTITLGAASALTKTVASSAATYTPSTAVQSSVGAIPAGGSFTTANVAQF